MKLLDCKLYILESVNIIRKYIQFLDLPISLLTSSYWYLVTYEQRKFIHVSIVRKKIKIISIKRIFKFLFQTAMSAHKSQYVWFRKIYMIFSRYTFINTLQEVNALDLELDFQLDD